MNMVNWKHIVIVAGVMAVFPALALAADKPTPAEAKKVIEYYYQGKGMTPVLAELKICHDIQRDGDNKNECAGDVTGQTIKRGDSDYIWMAFMAPSGGDPQNVSVELEQNGATSWTKTASVPGAIRSRTWYRHTFTKAGTWKLKVSTSNGNASETLGEMDLKVEK